MCAIFGLIDYNHVLSAKHRAKILQVLSKECEVRGTDATGFAYNSRGRLCVYKRPLPAHKMHLCLPPDANIVMGHTRMATQGDQKFNQNNHPFKGFADVPFALAHNGVIYNDNTIQLLHNFADSSIKTDSYVAVQLVEEQKKLNFKSLKTMAEELHGSFMFTLLDSRNNMYFVRGDNPIAIYRYNGFYVYASTNDILQSAMTKLGLDSFKREIVKMSGGDILKITATGELENSKFDYYNDFYDYYGFGGYRQITPKNDTRYSQVKDYATAMGFDADEIDMLLDYGYDYDEIEELLYEPTAFKEAISEICGIYEDELCEAFCT